LSNPGRPSAIEAVPISADATANYNSAGLPDGFSGECTVFPALLSTGDEEDHL
jgi:hypothetical protein